MAYDLKFHCGDKVRVIPENIEGIISSYYVPTSGMIMYGVMVPKRTEKCSYEGELVDISFDAAALVLVEKCDPSDPMYREFNTNNAFDIGDKVKDKINPERSGVVVGFRCFMNNCIHYVVDSGRLNDKGDVIRHRVPENILEKVGEVKSVEHLNVKKASKKKTGGPSFVTERPDYDY